MLAAADRLLATAGSPRSVTMDDFAAAAEVGKGTLFRAFGSRDGLLEALWSEKVAALRRAAQEGDPPLGPPTPPGERIVAFLDALLTFKLENRHLIRLREGNPAGVRQAENYLWSHRFLRGLIEAAAPETTQADAGYAAHVLLSALDVNLIDELISEGRSTEEIRASQARLARAVTAGA